MSNSDPVKQAEKYKAEIEQMMMRKQIRLANIIHKIIGGVPKNRAIIIEHRLNTKGIYTSASTIPRGELCIVMARKARVVFISIEKNKDLQPQKYQEEYSRQGYLYLGIYTREMCIKNKALR